MKHIATVQLQDYFHHKVFETIITKRHWSRFESRLRHNVDETLELLDRYGVKATFFTLGWIAEQLPDIVKQVHQSGHEIACAGYWGADRNVATQSEFREDMRLGREALEQVTGRAIDGYRSIRRSFGPKDLWLLDLVAEEGFRYDSSVMPIGLARINGTDVSRPFVRQTRIAPIHELPHATARLLGFRVPVGGGNFLRQLPQRFTMDRFLAWDRRADAPFVLYFHPWELDREIPAVSAFTTLTKVRQYRNLGRMRDLLPRYFEAAEFGTARDFLGLECRDVTTIQSVRRGSTPVVLHADAGTDPVPVTVVIPCHNEEASVVFLSRALDEVVTAAGDAYSMRFVLVDDKSTDDTVRLLRETFGSSDRFEVVTLEENRGVSGAILAGIDAAKTEYVCSMDADCSYDPLELLKMLPLLDDGTALVTASPYHHDGAVLGVPGWRLFLSRGLSGIYRSFLRHKLATYTSCFRAYRRSAALKFRPEYGDFRGIVELLVRMDMAGQQIREFPTTLQSRIFGFSKMKTLKTIRDHLRLLVRMRSFRREATSVESVER